VTDVSRIAFVVAAVFAVLNWLAVARRVEPLEYVSKPAVMVGLIAAVVAFDTPDERAWVFVAALAFSMLGDIFLMLPADRFLFGVGAFFLAHVAYIVGLRMDSSAGISLVAGIIVVGAFAITVGRHIVLAVRKQAPELATPVSAYVAVISVMVASAIATKNPYAAVGAVVFMASDTLIAWNRFVQPLTWAPVTIMVTYHVGQALLALSLVRR
jgi:uncharacterized membrane protein YhhN